MKAEWITPVITIFDEEGKVDIQANLRMYDHLMDGGMDGIAILGSIGEFFVLSMEEKKKMIQEAVKHINKRVKLYVGTGGMILDECVELSNYALEQGADAAMVISPYYFNLPKDSVLHFYDQLAARVSGPIVLYNFPDRTGYDLSPELVLELVRKHSNIIGIKDTVGAMGHTRSMIHTVVGEFPDFKVYSGFDEFFGHNLLSGGAGCIAGISNFAPKVASGYAQAAREDDLAKMAEYQKQIDSMMAIYEIGEQFIPIIKEAVAQVGIEVSTVCAQPLLSATSREQAAVDALLRSQGLK